MQKIETVVLSMIIVMALVVIASQGADWSDLCKPPNQNPYQPRDECKPWMARLFPESCTPESAERSAYIYETLQAWIR